MNIIIFFLLTVIILIIYNNCAVKEDFHNIYNRGYVNPYIQQPILFPIYSPYRRYYQINASLPLNAQVPLNYPYIPSMFAPYYSQYDILNRDGIIYR
jgi:hypothetical protein